MMLGRCFLLLFVLFITSCVTGDLVLDQSKAASLSHIHIAPIEGPPLYGGGLLRLSILPDTDMSSDDSGNPIVGYSALDSLFIRALSGGYIGEKDREIAVQSIKAEYVLDSYSDWDATVEFTKEVQRQLEAGGIYSADTSTEIKSLPGVTHRAATLYLENWYSPMRSWYRLDTSQYSYPGLPNSSAVLEVFSDYHLDEVIRNATYYLFFTVTARMKLVDPETGMVMANTVCSSYPVHVLTNDLNKMFSDDAAEFKTLFRKTAVSTATKCFAKIGLSTN